MIPIPFAEANKKFGPPPGYTEEQVSTIAVHDKKVPGVCGEPNCIIHSTHEYTSCWQATDEEIVEFIASKGRLYITIYGNVHPVLSATTIKPEFPEP